MKMRKLIQVYIQKYLLGAVMVDHMIVGFTTTYVISAYHHWSCEFDSCSGDVNSIQHDVIVCQWLATGQWFSMGTPVCPTNKTDRHDITEILLKMTLNTIILTPN